MKTLTEPLPPTNAGWLKYTLPDPLSLPPAAQSGDRKDKVRILVAEDDAVSRELICTRLENWGYEVVATQNGTEAIMALRKMDAPTLAILDWMMPGMDGLEICRRSREVERALYVIILTARDGMEHLVESLGAGADDYLAKPFDKDELQARILVGLRVMASQAELAGRVRELEAGGLRPPRPRDGAANDGKPNVAHV